MLSPSKRIEPDEGFTQPATVLMSVVLPTPLRPNTPTTSPLPTNSDTPCSTCDRP